VRPLEPPRYSNLTYFVVASLVLHLLLLLALRGAKLSLGGGEMAPVVVKLLPASPAADARAAAARNALAQAKPPAPPPKDESSRQIVSPSDKENELAPMGKAYLSDRDNRVERETINRGNPEAGAPQPADAKPPPESLAAQQPAPPPAPARPAAPAARPAPPVEKPAAPPKPAHPEPARPSSQRAQAKAPNERPAPGAAAAREPTLTEPGETEQARRTLPGRDKLFESPAELLAKNDASPGSPGAQAGADARSDPHRDLVSAPPPAPGIFAGARGSADYLPDIASSNLTLLNTKADRFAPFVRRVGMRVFQNLLIYQRRQLGPQEILAAHEPVTVRVTLGPDGKLKNMVVDDRSGSQAVDQTLLDACREAAFDNNPPTAAANDQGDYTFVFESQLFARLGDGPRGPTLYSVESRLRVGLL
jgi:TonB family protein